MPKFETESNTSLNAKENVIYNLEKYLSIYIA